MTLTLKTFPRAASNEDILAALAEDGALILEGMMDGSQAERLERELRPHIERSSRGVDGFSGFSTTRTGALMARSPAARELALNKRILGLADAFLKPYCEKYILHVTQAIRLLPGQGAQILHRDRWAWGYHMPQEIEPQINTIWALTDFTAENGATQIVPGSQRWDWEREAEPHEVTQAVMKRGSLLLYTGSVIHGGGANRSANERIGINLTYCLGWLRQEENQYLSCPPEVARDLPPELQDLLGYTMGSYALGYFSMREPPDGMPDTVPPELALGRLPRKAMAVNEVASGFVAAAG